MLNTVSCIVSAVTSSEDAYEKALKLAKENLPSTHPIKLGLALNFSVFYYEIADKKEKACQYAKDVSNAKYWAIELS